jgi:hypothetical protein
MTTSIQHGHAVFNEWLYHRRKHCLCLITVIYFWLDNVKLYGFHPVVCIESMNMTIDTTINEIIFKRRRTCIYLYMHRCYAACFDLYIGHHQAFIQIKLLGLSPQENYTDRATAAVGEVSANFCG